MLFSSHILAEVQQLCDHVIMLHRGRLIRACAMSELDGRGDTLRLRMSVAKKERELLPALRGLPCVQRVKSLPSMDIEISELMVECAVPEEGDGAVYTQLFRLLCALDAPVRMLVPQRDTLEQIFLRATADEEVGA